MSRSYRFHPLHSTILFLVLLALSPCLCQAVGSLSGSVVDATGDPIVGASVQAQNPNTSDSYFTNTTAGGDYEILNMVPGNYRVRAIQTAYQGAYHDGKTYEEEAPATVSVPDGGMVAGIDVTLPDGGSISGTITEETSGDPVQFFFVSIDYDTSPNIWWNAFGFTDSMGNYRIGGLPDRGDYTFGVSGDGYVPLYYPGVLDRANAERLSIAGGSNLTGIDLELSVGGVLRLAAFLESGLPVVQPGMPQILDNRLNRIAQDSGGGLWFASDEGVMSIVGDATRGIHPYNSDLPGEEVRDLSISPTDTRFYATNEGLGRQSGMGAVEAFTLANSNLPSNDCSAVLAVSNSDVYIGSVDGDFTVWNGTSTFANHVFSDRGEPFASEIYTLAHDSTDGEVLIGTASNGVSIYDIAGETFSRFTTTDGLPSNQVNAIAVMDSGVEWIGTVNGLYLRDPVNPDTTFNIGDGLPSANILDIHIVSATQVWIGTAGGIAHYDDGTFTAYTTSNSDLFSNFCRSICVRDGEVYIGSNNGLDILSDGSFRHYSRQNRFVSASVTEVNSGFFANGGASGSIDFVVNGLPTGNYRVFFSSSGYPSEYYDDVTAPEDATLIPVQQGMETAQRYAAVLDPFGGISGTVEDSLGNPLNSGTVRFYRVGEIIQTTSVNVSGGVYQTTSLAEGDYLAVFSSSGSPSVFYPSAFDIADAQPIAVASGQTTTGIDIVLPADTENGTVSGRLLDASGSPYPFASVGIQGAFSTGGSRSATTDEEGRYIFTEVPPGNYRVNGSPFGFPTLYYSSTFDQSQFQPVGVSSGQDVTGIDLQVPNFAPASLFGVVQNAGGSPVEGAEVDLFGGVSYPTQTTGADGTFSFTGLPPYPSYSVEAGKPNFVPDEAVGLALAGGASIGPVTLTLTGYAPTSLSGQVLDASGNEIWGISLQFSDNDSNLSVSVQTDWEGRFHVADFPPGNGTYSGFSGGYNGLDGSIDLNPGLNMETFVLIQNTTNGNLWGTVTDMGGTPQPGIQVQLSGAQSRFVRTNKFGKYLFSGLAPGAYNLELSDYLEDSTAIAGIMVAAGETLGELDFSIDKTLGYVTGRVTTTDGNGVRNPFVTPFGLSTNGYLYRDPYGKYGVCEIEPTQTFKLRIFETDFVNQYYSGKLTEVDGDAVTVSTSGEIPNIDFVLDPGESISGRVTDALGRPLHNASINVSSLIASYSKFGNSDIFGNYRVSGLIPSDYTVQVSRSGYYQEYYDNRPTFSGANAVTVSEGLSVSGIDFQIGVGGKISGKVIDASGTPYTSGTVYAYLASDPQTSLGSTSLDASGEYTLSTLPPGDFFIQAQIGNQPRVFHPSAYSIQSAMSVMVTENGMASGIDITVPSSVQPGSIDGRVTDENGEPLTIQVRASGVDGYMGTSAANPDATGNYLISGVPPGSYVVSVQRSNTPRYYHGGTYNESAATRVEVTPGAEVTGIDIQTVDRQFGEVTGTVRDPMGTPLPGVALELSGNNVFLTTTTGSDGSYRLTGVFPQGGYTLFGSLSGYFPNEAVNIAVPPNGSVVQNLVLADFVPGALAGKVRDSSGYPFQGAFLSVDGLDVNYSDSTISDFFGDYRFDILPAGSFRLTVFGSGFQSVQVSPVPVIEGDTVIRNVTLQETSATGSISGTVFDGNGSPSAGVRVQVNNPTFRQTATRLDGTYRLPGLSAGTYSVQLPNEEGTPTQENVQVVANQVSANVDFNLGATYGTIGGVIRDRMGAPLSGATVRANGSGHNFFPASVTSGSSGLYIIPRVENAGGKNYTVYAEMTGFVRTYFENSLTQGQATVFAVPDGGSVANVDITLGPAATVSGSVVDGDTSEPIASGSIVFNRGDLTEFGSIDNGIYQVRTLPPGDYTVSSSISGYSTEYYDNVQYEDLATALLVSEGATIEGIDFTPTRSASISGMVADESGTLYTSGSVRAYEISRGPEDYRSSSISNGMYTIGSLPVGEYYVYASVPNKPAVFHPSAFAAASAQTVMVAGGQERMGIDIVVPSSIENASISGRMLDRFGTVDSSIRARVIGVDGTSFNRNYNLNDEGVYLAEDLLPGSYIVGLVENRFPTFYYGNVFDMGSATRVTLAPGEARTGIDVTATEYPQATLQGFVHTQGGSPIPDAAVRLSGDEVAYDTISRSDGSFMFMNVFPRNDYTLKGSAFGFFENSTAPVVLIENQTTTQNLILEPYEVTSIVGQVTNASGYPLINATLNLSGPILVGSRFITADVFGRYKFDDLPPATYTVNVSKNGYVSEFANGVATIPGPPTVRNFVLQYDPSDGVVEGTVTDSAGNPAYGVLVRSSNSRTTTTNLDGTYQLTDLTPGTYSISLPNENDSENPSVDNVTVVADASTAGIDFTLDVAYGTIAGTVTDSGGIGIPFANVDPDPIGHSFSPSNVDTGYDGGYILARIRNDGGRSYILSAEEPGYVETYYGDTIDSDLATIVHLATGESFAPAPIQMQTAARISGTVKEEGTGRLVVSGNIRAEKEDGSRTFFASIDNSGDYRFDELPGGSYRVSTSISNHAIEYYEERRYSDEADLVAVAPGGTAEGIDLTPARAGSLSGMVRDSSGDVIVSGTVYALPVGRTNNDRVARGLGSGGEFTFTGLAPGPHLVYASVSGKPTVFFGNVFFADEATPVMVTAGLNTTGIDITVPIEVETGSISGRATNLFGEPYANLTLNINGVDGTGHNTSPRTDGSGDYLGSGLLPGLYTVAIRESGRPSYYYGDTFDQETAMRVRVEEGVETTGIDIMAPDRNDGSIRGRVQNASGAPLNGIDVQLSGNSVFQSASTGPNGLFQFLLVPPGDYQLSAKGRGFPPATVQVVVQAERLNAGTVITLESFTGGAIAGVVTDASGIPLEGASLNLNHGVYGFIDSARTTRYGDYYYDNLPPGVYSLNASSTGYNTASRTDVMIQGGGTTTEDFALEPRTNVGRVSGRVLGANGRPAYRVQVRSEGPSNRTTHTLPDGTYMLPNLNAGSYRVHLPSETGPAVENLDVTVADGETTEDVDFELDRSYGQVSGTVFEGETVNPVRDGSVRGEVFQTGGFIDEADIGNQGNYILGRIPVDATGGVRARAAADGYAQTYWMNSPIVPTADPVTLDAFGDASGVDFGLAAEAVLFGRITDLFGTPLDGASVNATLQNDEETITFSDSPNPNGWYETAQLPGGDYRLRFSRSNFNTAYHDDVPDEASATIVTVPAGSSRRVDAVLFPITAIGGRVTDASGNPVLNAFVDLYRVGNLNPSRLFVNGEGAFSFQGISPGDYRLRGDSPDFARRWWIGSPTAASATILTLGSGEIRGGVDIVLGGESTNVYDVIADGTINVLDLLELLGQGTDSSGVLFDFSRYWMNTSEKSLAGEER